MRKGIDTSTYDGVFDFRASSALGNEFAIIRAGQANWSDNQFVTSWAAAKGIVARGSYFFFDSRYAPEVQAATWANQIKGDLGELPHFLDLENGYAAQGDNGGTHGGQPNWYRLIIQMQSLVPGINLGIYTNYYYWRDSFMLDESRQWYSRFPLWIASYNPAPQIPAPWKDYAIWQYSETGNIATDGGRDLNYANDNFVISASPSQPPAPAVVPPAPQVVTPPAATMQVATFSPGLYRILDDVAALKIDKSLRPYLRNGLPATVTVYGAAANLVVPKNWMAWLLKVNGQKNMNYLFKDASGWHNAGSDNNVRELLFAGNVLEVTRIDTAVVNGHQITAAWFAHVSTSDTPPGVIRPDVNHPNTRIHRFSIQYTNHLDMTRDGNNTFVLPLFRPGEQPFIDVRQLEKTV